VSLYLNEHERSALASIDYDALRKLIDEAVWSGARACSMSLGSRAAETTSLAGYGGSNGT
jgi:hypothetical protein